MLKMKIGVWGRPRESGRWEQGGEGGGADPLVWVETQPSMCNQTHPHQKRFLTIWDEAHITKSLVWT